MLFHKVLQMKKVPRKYAPPYYKWKRFRVVLRKDGAEKFLWVVTTNEKGSAWFPFIDCGITTNKMHNFDGIPGSTGQSRVDPYESYLNSIQWWTQPSPPWAFFRKKGGKCAQALKFSSLTWFLSNELVPRLMVKGLNTKGEPRGNLVQGLANGSRLG